MFRAIAGVVVGYIVMGLIVFACLTAAYFMLGADRAFMTGSLVVSGLWVGVMVVVGILAAISGGAVCALIARRPMPVKVLAGIVLALGLLMAGQAVKTGAPTETRPPTMTNIEAMQKAHTPAWAQITNALIGFAGVMVGGGLGRTKATSF